MQNMGSHTLEQEYIGKAEAAAQLGVSTATIDRKVRAGELPAYQRGRTVVFRVKDIKRVKEPRPRAARVKVEEISPGRWRATATIINDDQRDTAQPEASTEEKPGAEEKNGNQSN